MKQVLIIHGGNSYPNYNAYIDALKKTELDYGRLLKRRGWKDELADYLIDTDILLPTMPNSANARYDEWKIWFEKIIPHLTNNATIIGHSLGAMFLAKYLHETPLKNPVHRLILLAGGYDEPIEDYGDFRVDSATGLEHSADEIHVMHSEDDPIVPYNALDKYERDLPTATIHRFNDKNHFLNETFPELLEILQQK